MNAASLSPGLGSPPLRRVHWIDLVDPDDAQLGALERELNLHIPRRAELAEIEATSRLRCDGDTLSMSLPLATGAGEEPPQPAPTGIVLRPDLCLTVHFAPLQVFDRLAQELAEQAPSAGEVFVRLVEALVDSAADQLELCGEALHKISRSVFHPDPQPGRRRRRDSGQLRGVMIRLGRSSDRMSQVRYALACLARIGQFVLERAGWLEQPLRVRLEAVAVDIESLARYEDDLASRVQFLQDAATSIVNIEQNEIMKVLTVVSVAGVPPVLVVGVYGMNFRHMPELDWTLGYPLALLLTLLSAAVPLLWFRRRGWI